MGRVSSKTSYVVRMNWNQVSMGASIEPHAMLDVDNIEPEKDWRG